jgi:hypothetical protein
MRRVYTERLVESQYLCLEDLQKECFHGISLDNLKSLGKNAGLLVFTEPSNAASCRKWFVESSIVLENINTAKDMDLVNAVRYVWKKVLNPELCYDLTLEAMKHLDDVHKVVLRRALYKEHSGNLWLQAHLAKPLSVVEGEPDSVIDTLALQAIGEGSSGPNPDQDAEVEPLLLQNTSSSSADPPSELAKFDLQKWYPMGKHSECRQCGFRPPPQSFIKRTIRILSKHLEQRAQDCETCEYRTMESKVLEEPAPVAGTLSNVGNDSRVAVTDDDESDEAGEPN